MNIMHVAVVVQEEMQCSFEASRGAVRDVNLCFLPLPSPPVDRGAGQTSGNCTPLLFSTDFKEPCATAGLFLCSPPSPLFFCSTSIRLVLDCRASARRSLWSRGASQTLSRSPVETRIGEDMGERGAERIARKDRTAFSVFFLKHRAVNESVEDY